MMIFTLDDKIEHSQHLEQNYDLPEKKINVF